VELAKVEGRTLHLRGVDLLDGTPVLDIKPYVPYADAFPEAKAGWIDDLDAKVGRRSSPGPRKPR
jgi:tRNA (Thr-GGU) A37 N-methylase